MMEKLAQIEHGCITPATLALIAEHKVNGRQAELFKAVITIDGHRHAVPNIFKHVLDQQSHFFVIVDHENPRHSTIEAQQAAEGK